MNTVFLLMAEFGTSEIPLRLVADKYFALDEKKMQSHARQQKFPFPVYRGGSQKSEWLVSASDLAGHIDKAKADAKLLHAAKQQIHAA